MGIRKAGRHGASVVAHRHYAEQSAHLIGSDQALQRCVDGMVLTSRSAFVPSPDVKIFPGRYIAALPPFTGLGSIVVQVWVSTRRAWVTTGINADS